MGDSGTVHAPYVPLSSHAPIQWECEYCGVFNEHNWKRCTECGAPRKVPTRKVEFIDVGNMTMREASDALAAVKARMKQRKG